MLHVRKRKILMLIITLFILTGCGGTSSDDEDGNGSGNPQVNLNSNISAVAQGGSIILSWTSSNISSCTASGDWTGVKTTSGSEIIDSLTAESSFTLTCTGDNGSAEDSVNVSAVVVNNGSALLTWISPTENTDETSLTDLAGYKIYSGTSSGSYGTPITINDAAISSYLVEGLSAGEWFFSVKAYNASGTDSPFATEVSKTIN